MSVYALVLVRHAREEGEEEEEERGAGSTTNNSRRGDFKRQIKRKRLIEFIVSLRKRKFQVRASFNELRIPFSQRVSAAASLCCRNQL